ncbi:MAG: hypothetical protein K2X43_01075 [Hyphomonadaceae bacterium]|nr:hypothetical protein [Hyphomonadaceae bacterium]
MLDLKLRYEGNGLFRVATKEDAQKAAREFEQGEAVKARCTSRFTVTQGALFHAMCRIAFDNQTTTQPDLPSWRHLKSWVKIKAGHCDVVTFTDGFSAEAAKYLRQRYDTMDFTLNIKTGAVAMKTARSLTELSRDDMGVLIDKAKAIIEQHIVPGVDLDELMVEARRKVAA